jgi:putative N6-adenine-specific DNA methylase
MGKIELIATTTFGLEAVAKRELESLGHSGMKVENGKIEYVGELVDIVRSNLWLRTADRILVKMGEFKALSFEELFQGVKAIPWEDWIPEDGNFIVDGKSLSSKLYSISDSQRITEKAIVERLKQTYPVEWFSKSGPRFRVEVSILKDIATITLDTSGDGLHKRGYRDRAGDAPIKETLAAAMVMLSYWNKDRILLDPFCGSGTILIEAAMIGKNIAPGLDRSFDAEKWPVVPEELWNEERIKARKAIDHSVKLNLLGCDTDKRSILRARDNAANLGLEDDIAFFVKDMREVDLNDDYGVVITNPPYGERMGEMEEIKMLHKDLGEKFRALSTWSVYVITSNEEFEMQYGKKADRKRKLYNGRIKVDYYQYYGPRPT